MKLNREQIVKALECCGRNVGSNCHDCPYCGLSPWSAECRLVLVKDALALIRELTVELDAMRGAANSYKMDNQRLTEENERLSAGYEKAQILSVFPKEEELKYLNALERMAKEYQTVRADTVRKMLERLKAEAIVIRDHAGEFDLVVFESDIDQIAKEMLEEG